MAKTARSSKPTVPPVQQSMTMDPETGDLMRIDVVLMADGHISKNKIRFGASGDGDAFLNIVYVRKGILDDRLIEGLRITIEPIYDRDNAGIKARP